MGCQDAVISQQVDPGGGHEHAQLLNQLQRIQQHVRGPICPGVRKRVQQLAVRAFRQDRADPGGRWPNLGGEAAILSVERATDHALASAVVTSFRT
jgi:hypothetical protein